jgi:hypothetical protein
MEEAKAPSYDEDHPPLDYDEDTTTTTTTTTKTKLILNQETLRKMSPSVAISSLKKKKKSGNNDGGDADSHNGNANANANANDNANDNESIMMLRQDDKHDTPIIINFLNDPRDHMTFGRRMALWLSSNYAWYNPQLNVVTTQDDNVDDDNDDDDNDDNDDNEAHQPTIPMKTPSLAKAWTFFEHVTLPRYIVLEQEDNHEQDRNKRSQPLQRRVRQTLMRGDRQLIKAEPGECDLPTKLYSPLNTPLSQMGDFGVGYGLYFLTVRSVAILSLLAGLLNVSTMVYYASDEYDATGSHDINSIWMKGSVICTGTCVCVCVCVCVFVFVGSGACLPPS